MSDIPNLALSNAVDRRAIAARRLVLVLASNTVANNRTLEQKISDAGPGHMRVDPHILSPVLKKLVNDGTITRIQDPVTQTPWYHLTRTPFPEVQARLDLLLPLHRELLKRPFLQRMGQTLEIATYRALLTFQPSFSGIFGGYRDLNDHDDSKSYRRIEPPVLIDGLSSEKPLDYLVQTKHGPLGIEVKNLREWLYPDRYEVRELLDKACKINAVPVLIARRIPFVTRKLLTACGALVHENFNQLFPEADRQLAEQVRHKDRLGYHDVRTGNQPDSRMLHFIGTNMPNLVEQSRDIFETYKDLLGAFGSGAIEYKEFAARVRRRSNGHKEDNDWPDPGPDMFDL